MRAEELVVEIYRQKKELQAHNSKASQVVMSMEAWRHIQAWHRARGPLERAPHLDYIHEDSIFGLEVFIDNVPAPLVKISPKGNFP